MKNVTKIAVVLLVFMISTVSAKVHNLTQKENFIDVPGGKIWYKIIYSEKSKNNTPLLFLHGGPGVPHDYLEVFKSLANDRPVIFYDQLGCGHSKVQKADTKLWILDRYVTELNTLIDHLNFKKVHLFGHSWGGALAIEYTLKHPEKIASLTLASPLLSTKWWVADAKRLVSELPLPIQKEIYKNEEQGTTDSIEYKNAIDVFYQHFVFHMKQWPATLKYSLDNINFDIYKTMWGPSELTATGNLKDFDRIGDLQYLTMPVLLTCGRYDEATPETLKHVLTFLKHGKLIVYDNSAHFAFLNEDNKYLKDLGMFLESVDKMTNYIIRN